MGSQSPEGLGCTSLVRILWRKLVHPAVSAARYEMGGYGQEVSCPENNYPPDLVANGYARKTGTQQMEEDSWR